MSGENKIFASKYLLDNLNPESNDFDEEYNKTLTNSSNEYLTSNLKLSYIIDEQVTLQKGYISKAVKNIVLNLQSNNTENNESDDLFLKMFEILYKLWFDNNQDYSTFLNTLKKEYGL